MDAAGYLVESAYDDQGNVVQQRKYATALDLASVNAGTRPTAPGGNVFTIDRTYDAANRLISEQSPPVTVDGVVTTAPAGAGQTDGGKGCFVNVDWVAAG